MTPRPRVAIVSGSDATDPRSWSGTPAAIVRGLREAGAEPVVVPTGLPQALRLPLGAYGRLRHADATTSHRGRAWVAARSAVVDRRLRETVADGALVLATDSFLLRDPGVPWATFDDMTATQALAIPDSELRRYPPAQAARWAARHGRLCRRASACCAVSPWAADSIVADHGVPRGRVHVVGIGADGGGDAVQRDWSLPRFLFVGIDWERKNGAAVLRAFRRLRSEVPGASLDLVGGHPPVAEEGVRGHGVLRIDDADAQRRLAGLYAAATCFVLPSLLEPAGIVYVEAARHGVPSIGTAVGGASHLIGDGGTVVDPHDDDALLRAMRRLARPEEARGTGTAAHEHARELTWRRTAERILEALGLR